MVTAKDFDPYPGNFLTNELEDMIFKANIMLAMDYFSKGDVESARETMNNIYLSKYDAKPKFNGTKTLENVINCIKMIKEKYMEVFCYGYR